MEGDGPQNTLSKSLHYLSEPDRLRKKGDRWRQDHVAASNDSNASNVRHLDTAVKVRRTDRDVSELRESVNALTAQCDQVSNPGLVNLKAVRACLRLVSIWLERDVGVAEKICNAHEGMVGVIQSNVDTEWLFAEDGEPQAEAMSPEAFEVLIELRVLADRLERSGVIQEFVAG